MQAANSQPRKKAAASSALEFLSLKTSKNEETEQNISKS